MFIIADWSIFIQVALKSFSGNADVSVILALAPTDCPFSFSFIKQFHHTKNHLCSSWFLVWWIIFYRNLEILMLWDSGSYLKIFRFSFFFFLSFIEIYFICKKLSLLKIYNLMSLTYVYTCGTITTIQVVNISITDKFPPAFLFCFMTLFWHLFFFFLLWVGDKAQVPQSIFTDTLSSLLWAAFWFPM